MTVETLTDLILEGAGAPWIYLMVLLLSCIDGFFPPVPSESVVVALASIGIATGEPSLTGIGVAAAVGAIVGDNIAYGIGRKIGARRFSWMRRRRVAKVFHFAESQLGRRGALLILTARYIPVGRVAVNTTAGGTHYPWRRFLPLSIVAGLSWALYSILIGALAGHWVKDNPILGVAIAIAAAMIIGLVIDKIISRITRHHDPVSRAADEPGSPPTDDATTRDRA